MSTVPTARIRGSLHKIIPRCPQHQIWFRPESAAGQSSEILRARHDKQKRSTNSRLLMKLGRSQNKSRRLPRGLINPGWLSPAHGNASVLRGALKPLKAPGGESLDTTTRIQARLVSAQSWQGQRRSCQACLGLSSQHRPGIRPAQRQREGLPFSRQNRQVVKVHRVIREVPCALIGCVQRRAPVTGCSDRG